MKRTLFCLIFSLNAYFAFSSTFQVNGFNYYRFAKDSVSFVGCDSTMLQKNHIKSIIIPSKITYSDSCYQVVAFGIINYEKYPTITDISFPSSINYLYYSYDTNVFDSYPNLKSITVSSNNKQYKSIDGVLFDKKAKVLIKYPSGINIASYSVPISVKFIENKAFYNCKELQNISIPTSVKKIYSNNFVACNKLRKITVDNKNLKYKSIDGVLYNGKKTVLLKYPIGIRASTFRLPSSVKTIERNAFTDNYSLNHIELSSTVDTIYENAFENCAGLKNITFPSSVSKVARNAFKSCRNLRSVIISSTKTKFQSEVFAYCDSLKTIVFPPGQSVIESQMFKNCTGLSNLTIPTSIHSIGANAFQGCTGLTELILPSSLNKVGSGAFEDCTGVKKILLPASLTIIEVGAFKGCTGISDLSIPTTIKHISAKAFWGCTNLKSVTIPSSVLSIGTEAFSDCTNLIDIQYPDTHISLGQNVFNNTAYVNSQPNGMVYLNRTAYIIKGRLITPSIEFKEGTTCIADYAFCNQGIYFDLKIPNSVRYIGSNAFRKCENLKGNISLPLSPSYIGDQAFYKCSNLTNITIPSSVKYIGEEAFRECYKLKNIQVSDSTNFVGMFAFSNTDWLDNQPDGLIYIGNKLYKYKGKMPEKATIEIRTGTTAIIGGAFSNCNKMEIISLPSTITKIGNKAFKNCTGLNSITIPLSVTTIEDDAFAGCSRLSSMYVLASEPIIFFNKNNTFPSIPIHMFTNGEINIVGNDLLDDFSTQVYNAERALAHGNGKFALDGIDKDVCTLYVPIGSKKLYEHAEQWKNFKKIVEFDSSSGK